MARRLLTLLSTLLLALALGQPTSASAAEGRPYTNPVKAQKGADPWNSYHDGNYYLVSTSWTDVITMRKSPTLAGLARGRPGERRPAAAHRIPGAEQETAGRPAGWTPSAS